MKDSFTKMFTLQTSGLGDDAVYLNISNFSSVAIVLASTVIMGGLSLIIFRRYWRTEEVFTSPVRSDWQFTRHHQDGPEIVSGEGYRIIRRNPEDDHPLGQLRQRIRNSQPNAVENPTGEPTWQSHNTSADTLVGLWKDTKWGTSKVSLTNDTSDEKHENLIELETEGPNKTFFDPGTGEFIHLTPWKSAGGEESHGLKPDGKGSTKRALAQMTLGGTGWAGGKNIDDQLAEELQAYSKGVEKKDSESHKAGDCITGHMVNEVPSGKHTMVWGSLVLCGKGNTADRGLEDSNAAANEDDTEDADPKVVAFLLRKPWYAGTKHDIDIDIDIDIDVDADADADADSNVEDAGPEINSASASNSETEQEDVGFWIPQPMRDGRMLYRNTLTGVSRSELPPNNFKLANPTPDWETKAMDSSELPYADRDYIARDFFKILARELAHIDDDEGGDADATLAKLEGKYSKSQAGPSEEQNVKRTSVEQQWQALLLEAERKKADRLYYRRPSSIFNDDESIISSGATSDEEAAGMDAEEQNFDQGWDWSRNWSKERQMANISNCWQILWETGYSSFQRSLWTQSSESRHVSNSRPWLTA